MIMKRLIFSIILFSLFPFITFASEVEILTKSLKDVCMSPDQSGKIFEVKGEGSAGVEIKFIDTEIKGVLNQGEWEGVQKVLKEQQHSENSDYRKCVKDMLPTFTKLLNKTSADMKSKPLESDISQERVFSLGKGVQEQGDISAKFNNCKPINNYKDVECHVVVVAEKDGVLMLYNDNSQFAPAYFDENLDSKGSYRLQLKEKSTGISKYDYKMIAGVPIKVAYTHSNTNNKINSYFFNVGWDGKVYSFKFSSND